VEVFLGGLSSIFYGVGDFLGGEGAKRAPAASIVLWAGVVSFPLMAVLAFVVGGDPTTNDLLLGAIAGAMGSVGLVALFAGLSRGQAAAVAPAAAAIGAMLPVGVGVLGGERPSTLAWLGVAIAIPAILLCAWVVDPGDVPGGGLAYGLVAGLGFGGFTAVINFTSDASKLFPLVTSRATTMAMILLISAFGLWRVTGFSKVPKPIVIGSGVLDVAGNVAVLLALRAGSLALAAVSASFYPAITVVMARLVNAERLHVRQVFGLLLALVALAAIAVG
jgi:drug/metabolite transporter (DMT)-like permease